VTPLEITLGEHTLPVYPQRHAYLSNRLGRFIDDLLQDASGTSTPAASSTAVQQSSYELLCVLVPNLEKRVPEYEFGATHPGRRWTGDYDEQADKSRRSRRSGRPSRSPRRSTPSTFSRRCGRVDPHVAQGDRERADRGSDLADLADLALREWGFDIDAFYDETPNLDGERGLTVPRLRELWPPTNAATTANCTTSAWPPPSPTTTPETSRRPSRPPARSAMGRRSTTAKKWW
jgi:hypothetical protein